MLGKPDPVAAAAAVDSRLSHGSAAQPRPNWRVLYALHLHPAVPETIAQSRHAPGDAPGKPYLQISQQGVWGCSRELMAGPPELAHYAFRQGLRPPALPADRPVVEALDRGAPHTFTRVVDQDLASEPLAVLDLERRQPGDPDGPADVSDDRLVHGDTDRPRAGDAGSAVGIGRYDEVRARLHEPDLRAARGNDGPEERGPSTSARSLPRGGHARLRTARRRDPQLQRTTPALSTTARRSFWNTGLRAGLKTRPTP